MFLAFLLLALAAAPAETIVVEGRRPEEVRREATEFVRATGVAQQPVARWIEPLCPKVVGLSQALAARVAARVREVAKLAGAPVAKDRCDGNVMIAFTRTGEALVKAMAARSRDTFKDVDTRHRQHLYAPATPIRWWHVIQERTKDGQSDVGNEVPPSARLDGPGGVPLGGNVFTQYRSSFAGTQMVRVLRSATVIIDVDNAEGKALDSVIDFAALVALAEIRPSEPPPPSSILSLFEAQGAVALTGLDTKFLSALYKLPLDKSAVAHRGMLIRGLVPGDER